MNSLPSQIPTVSRHLGTTQLQTYHQMKIIVRITLSLVVVVVIYLLIYWKCFSEGFRRTGNESNIISLLIAILIGIVVWTKIKNISTGLPAYIFAGGILVGTTSFIFGFFGPLIFAPSNNLGPLLGIFFTGPFGFLFGLFLGGLYWNKKVKNK